MIPHAPGHGNIGHEEQHRRRRLGVAGLAGGVALVVVLLATGAGLWWRLLAFVPFWAGTLGLVQSRENVCVLLAMRGTQMLGGAGGEERVTDPGRRRELRRRGLRLAARSAAWAGALTLGVLALPGG